MIRLRVSQSNLLWAGSVLLLVAGVWRGVAVGCQPDESPAASSVVAAVVNGQPISLAEVRHEVAKAVGSRRPGADEEKLLLAQALGQLVDRQLVFEFLEQRGEALHESALDEELRRIRERLEAKKVSWSDFLARLERTEAEYRRELRWQLSWSRFLEPRLADEPVQAYFAGHRREFDGTELRVAHLLLKSRDATEEAAQRAEAERIRQAVIRGELSFSDAARRHSQAATASAGGLLGWIRRHEPMPESFSQAAFALQPGEISPPVTSPFGVHLIQCLEVKAGTRDWPAASEALRLAITRDTFQQIATKRRAGATIEFTGRVPYFRAGTHELVE